MARTPRLLASAAMLSIAALALTACGTSQSAPPVDTSKADPALQALLPEDLQNGGTLKVAADLGAPFNSYDSDGKTIIGLEPDIADAIGELLGLEFEFNAVPFDTMIPSMQAGKFDIAMAGLSDTPERQEVFTFIDYLVTGGSFMVNKGDATQPDSLEGLCGLTVGAQSATIVVSYLEGVVAPECPADAPLELSQFGTQDDVIMALRSGRVDVAVIPAPSAGYLVVTTGDEFEVPFTLYLGVLGIAIPKEQTELVDAFYAAMQKLFENGTYAELLAKYGLSDLALDEITVNAAE